MAPLSTLFFAAGIKYNTNYVHEILLPLFLGYHLSNFNHFLGTTINFNFNFTPHPKNFKYCINNFIHVSGFFDLRCFIKVTYEIINNNSLMQIKNLMKTYLRMNTQSGYCISHCRHLFIGNSLLLNRCESLNDSLKFGPGCVYITMLVTGSNPGDKITREFSHQDQCLRNCISIIALFEENSLKRHKGNVYGSRFSTCANCKHTYRYLATTYLAFDDSGEKAVPVLRLMQATNLCQFYEPVCCVNLASLSVLISPLVCHICCNKIMNRWIGRVALVTGASSGIGAAICKVLVKEGLKVVGCARNIDKINELSAELSSLNFSGELHGIRCDLTKEEDILTMFAKIKTKYNRLDICVNNAGIGKSAPVLTGSTAEWRSMLDVNVLGLNICTREAYKIMQECDIDDGQFININSMSGHRIPPNNLTNYYSATKYMVTALTEGLRRELAAKKSNIRAVFITGTLRKIMASEDPSDPHDSRQQTFFYVDNDM
ncbi:Dehydrogenase/reductase SDR family member 11 [Nymphon striatum]|nr:Dehydrogenase/reductase SDR family member 11 [Nymphon striatum]